MASNYDLLFQELSEQIREVSPQTAEVLYQLRQECGAKIGYYATFIFICLEAQRETNPELQNGSEIDVENLRSFTFFEAAKDEPLALGLFNAALECYRRVLSQRNEPADDEMRYG